jgi:hypothetical protein
MEILSFGGYKNYIGKDVFSKKKCVLRLKIEDEIYNIEVDKFKSKKFFYDAKFFNEDTSDSEEIIGYAFNYKESASCLEILGKIGIFCGTFNEIKKLKIKYLMQSIIFLAEHFFHLDKIYLYDNAHSPSMTTETSTNMSLLFSFTRGKLFYQNVDERFKINHSNTITIADKIKYFKLDKFTVKELLHDLSLPELSLDKNDYFILKNNINKCLEISKLEDTLSCHEFFKIVYLRKDTQDYCNIFFSILSNIDLLLNEYNAVTNLYNFVKWVNYVKINIGLVIFFKNN